MRIFLVAAAASLALVGCDADKDRPNNKPGVEVNKTPDLDPSTDDDVDVKLPDVDVNAKQTPSGVPDVDVDVMKPADSDTKANEDEPAGTDASLEPPAEGLEAQPPLDDVELDSAADNSDSAKQ